LLVFCVFVVMFRQPPPPAETDDEDTGAPPVTATNAGQGRRFDNAFGSLAALVPQGGSTPVTATPAAALAGSAAAGAVSAGDAAPQAVEANAQAVHGEQFRDLGWIRAQGGAYTLQVLGAHDEASVRQFIATQQNGDQFRYIEVMEGGAPWYVVIYGSFDTREAAIAAVGSIDGLPSRPFVRQFSAYVGAAPAAPATPVDAAPPAASQSAPPG
jgi:septal ring-binding cell division protein DamX